MTQQNDGDAKAMTERIEWDGNEVLVRSYTGAIRSATAADLEFAGYVHVSAIPGAEAVRPEHEAGCSCSVCFPGDERQKGIVHKYRVQRLNDDAGKHRNCEYFVLDLQHDKFAAPSLVAYAAACRDEYPVLANSLERRFWGPAQAFSCATTWGLQDQLSKQQTENDLRRHELCNLLELETDTTWGDLFAELRTELAGATEELTEQQAEHERVVAELEAVRLELEQTEHLRSVEVASVKELQRLLTTERARAEEAERVGAVETRNANRLFAELAAANARAGRLEEALRAAREREQLLRNWLGTNAKQMHLPAEAKEAYSFVLVWLDENQGALSAAPQASTEQGGAGVWLGAALTERKEGT